MPVKTVQELVDYAKKNPGKLAFASSGSGTSIHMAGELFKMQTGIDVLHVPCSAPAITDLIGGQVQFMFDNMPARTVGQRAGDDHRALQEPDVPTMKEAGFANFDVSSWFGRSPRPARRPRSSTSSTPPW